jgi:hypothetical protein
MDGYIVKLLDEFDRVPYDEDHVDPKYHSRYEGLADMIDEIEQYYHYTDERYSVKLFKDTLLWATLWEEKDGDCATFIYYLELCIEHMLKC